MPNFLFRRSSKLKLEKKQVIRVSYTILKTREIEILAEKNKVDDDDDISDDTSVASIETIKLKGPTESPPRSVQKTFVK